MDVKEILLQMTLEEKAQMCSGADFWRAKGIDKYGIPSLMLSDGPHGLRKQEGETDHLGIKSIKSVCFPAGCTVASSFDRNIMQLLGETLGEECQAENVDILLGPAINVKRSPLCGRNFEYLSEDPVVAGELSAAYIKGIQGKGIGACPKHFFAYNQEKRRMNSSSNMTERTAREIYLNGFERMVKKSKPWSIMSAYNQINGVYASEQKKYLTDVLRKEWGFDGFVVSDWGRSMILLRI